MEKLTELPKEKVYQYLGYQKEMQMPTDAIQALVAKCITEVLEASAPKISLSRLLPLQMEKDCIYADTLRLEGEDIKAHLQNCHSAVLLAVTLGSQIDTLLRTAEVMDMAKAVVLESAANVAIEQYADIAETELRQTLEAKQQYLTMRFSPGYGDLPITTQKPLLQMLDASKKIGLTLSQSNLMIPRKSITAILGVADIPVKGKLAGCAHCVLKDNCAYRKRGTTCAEF